jgi:hypothetical protein
LKDKSEDRTAKINSILKQEEKKMITKSATGHIYSKKIVTRALPNPVIKKKF